MLTIKLPIKTSEEGISRIRDLQQVYSSAVRFSFNRFKDNLNQKRAREAGRVLFQPTLGSWLFQCAVMEASGLYTKFMKDLKVPVFGGKHNFEKYTKKLITKDQLRKARLLSLCSQGEKNCCGNRHFTLDIMENNQITFKLLKQKITLQLPKLKKNYKRALFALQEACEKKEITYTVHLAHDYISISFDDPRQNKSLEKTFKNINKFVNVPLEVKRALRKDAVDLQKLGKELIVTKKNGKIIETITDLKKSFEAMKSRVLGIDQNPNYIGLSIIEFSPDDSFKTVFKQVYNLKYLSTRDNRFKDKRHFELVEISKNIVELAKHYRCSKIAVEDLSNIHKSKMVGKALNRLTKRDWCRKKFIASLKKHSELQYIELIEVNAAYSSTIGNVMFGSVHCPDMVAASIEVARRGYNKFTKGWFYPKLDVRSLDERWKQTLDGCSTWVEVHQRIKNSKVKYRVPLEDSKPSRVFSFSSRKSYIKVQSYT